MSVLLLKIRAVLVCPFVIIRLPQIIKRLSVFGFILNLDTHPLSAENQTNVGKYKCVTTKCKSHLRLSFSHFSSILNN